jgi:uncharacterized OB-fold protein
MSHYEMSVPIRPVADLTSRPYWESLKQKNLKVQQCLQCRRHRFPPLPGCPYCGSVEDEWVAVSGKATLYSWIVVHAPINPELNDDVPYAVGLAKLEEGPRMAGRIVGCSPDRLKKDMPLRFYYKVVDDELTLLTFEPIVET